jgi:hypothetical protein
MKLHACGAERLANTRPQTRSQVVKLIYTRGDYDQCTAARKMRVPEAHAAEVDRTPVLKRKTNFGKESSEANWFDLKHIHVLCPYPVLSSLKPACLQ